MSNRKLTLTKIIKFAHKSELHTVRLNYYVFLELWNHHEIRRCCNKSQTIYSILIIFPISWVSQTDLRNHLLPIRTKLWKTTAVSWPHIMCFFQCDAVVTIQSKHELVKDGQVLQEFVHRDASRLQGETEISQKPIYRAHGSKQTQETTVSKYMQN